MWIVFFSTRVQGGLWEGFHMSLGRTTLMKTAERGYEEHNY
jgi:hypothetical protein